MAGARSKKSQVKVVLITKPADKAETPQTTDSEPDVGLLSSSSNEEADTSRLNKAKAELGGNTSSSDDDEPYYAKKQIALWVAQVQRASMTSQSGTPE
jgi:hypothetical protein